MVKFLTHVAELCTGNRTHTKPVASKHWRMTSA